MSNGTLKDRSAKIPRGRTLLCDPVLNKGTVFNEAEREALGLHGLLPPRVFSPAQRTQHIINNVRRKTTDLEKYFYLAGLQNRNENLFYRVLIGNMQELIPISILQLSDWPVRNTAEFSANPAAYSLLNMIAAA